MTEVISEKFDPQTFTIMTGIRHLTNEQKPVAQQQMMMAQQSGQPVPPEMQEQLAAPTWEEILSVLRDEMVLSYRVDVETDSTIQADEGAGKAGHDRANVRHVAVCGHHRARRTVRIPAGRSRQVADADRCPQVQGGRRTGSGYREHPASAPQQKQDDGSQAQLQMQQMQMQHEQQLKQADIQHEQALKSAELQNGQQVEAIRAATAQAKIQSDERIAQLNAQVEQQRMALDHEKAIAQLVQAEAADKRAMQTRGEVTA